MDVCFKERLAFDIEYICLDARKVIYGYICISHKLYSNYSTQLQTE